MNKVNVELSDRDLDLLLGAIESHMESWDAYRIKGDLSILALRFRAFQQQMQPQQEVYAEIENADWGLGL